MSHSVAATELGRLLGVLSHPHRLEIIEELRRGERDVASLQTLLSIPHSGVSQHLAQLRAHRLVTERREGRHIHYSLRDQELAEWLLRGLGFILTDVQRAGEIGAAVEKAQQDWSRMA